MHKPSAHVRVVCGHSIEEISTIIRPVQHRPQPPAARQRTLRQRIEAEPEWAELGQEDS